MQKLFELTKRSEGYYKFREIDNEERTNILKKLLKLIGQIREIADERVTKLIPPHGDDKVPVFNKVDGKIVQYSIFAADNPEFSGFGGKK